MDDKWVFSKACEVWRQEAEGVCGLTELVDREMFCRVAHAVADCKGRILVAGCGTSAAAAKKIAHSLCCVERPAAFLTPSDAVHGGLGLLQKDDILILISKGGNTKELAALIPACKTMKPA